MRARHHHGARDEARHLDFVAASEAPSLPRIQRISAIRAFLIVAFALCADSFLLHGRNNRMAAMIKSHPGLKPLEEVDGEMAELIAQEQRRQACAPRPKTLRERARNPSARAPYRDAFASTRPRPSTPSTRPWGARAPSRDPRRHRRVSQNTVHVHRAHRVGELRQ